MMKYRSYGDTISALVVGLIGLIIVFIGSDYTIGTPRRMGPGFFPVVIGTILILFSAGLLVEARRAEPAQTKFAVRPFIMITAAVLSFGALMERAGLLPATLVLVALSALAERPFRPVTTLLSALALAAFGILIFVHALGLPLSAFHW